MAKISPSLFRFLWGGLFGHPSCAYGISPFKGGVSLPLQSLYSNHSSITMKTISKTTLQFLKDLKKNNDRDWFNDNKSQYKKAKQEFEQFVDELIQSLSAFDPEIVHQTAKNCIFRIYRDVRFSHDKSPYKTNFGAHITGATKKSELHSLAGYYLHIEPGESFLAGGAYLPTGDWLKAIRKEIDENAGELKKILSSKNFKNTFGEMKGEKLKTSPRDYPSDHPEIELLRYKSFLAVHNLNDEQILAGDFLNHCTDVFKALYPLDQFLNNSLKKHSR